VAPIKQISRNLFAGRIAVEYHSWHGRKKAMTTAVTIQDVIDQLGEIIAECQQANSRLGYFPAMYRKVTVRIKEGVENGRFQDPDRLEHLDVVFDRTQEPQHTVFQHLLLGMNAHINLDLGIAAAEVCQNCDLAPLKEDFFAINEVLAGLLDEVQDNLNQSSPLFQHIDSLGGRVDETLGNFSLRRARRAAWRKAIALHNLPPTDHPDAIYRYDRSTSRLAQIICPTGGVAQLLSSNISRHELEEPHQIISILL
jgi:hypothetical protein